MARDQHPQYLGWVLTESAADTYTEQQVVLPLGLVGGAQQNMALEATRCVWDNDRPNRVPSLDTRFASHISVRGKTSVGSFNDGDIIDKVQSEIIVSAAVTVNFQLIPAVRPNRDVDMTTGDGFGPLYASSSLFIGAQGEGGNTQPRTTRGRLYYRMRKVSTTELLGLAAQLTDSS